MKRTRLRPFSLKRAQENAAYAPWRERVMRARMGCEFWNLTPFNIPAGIPRCSGVDVLHHIHRLSQGGARMDEANVARLCWDHHRWVHDHPAQAKEWGLLA